eukprot:9450788-Pyramimonas_sp.AAC.1
MVPTIHGATNEDNTSISMHIGDHSFDAVGCAVESCLNGLADLAGRAPRQFTRTLEPPMHVKKFNVTATRHEALKQAPQALEEHLGTIGNAILTLGVDCRIGTVKTIGNAPRKSVA